MIMGKMCNNSLQKCKGKKKGVLLNYVAYRINSMDKRFSKSEFPFTVLICQQKSENEDLLFFPLLRKKIAALNC